MLPLIVFCSLVVCAAATQTYNLTIDENVVETEFDIPVRIVNGIEATPHEFPFMARLSVGWSDARGMCGGSLINQQFILTAAHCFYHPDTNEFAKTVTVYLADHNLKRPDAKRVTAQGVQVFLNNYNAAYHYNDIALIELSQPVSYTTGISNICVDRAGSNHVGQRAKAAGWGALGSNKPTSDVLRKVDIPVLSDSSCSRYNFYSDVMLCGGYTDGSKDTCQGDSGGPLFLQNGNSFTLIGATSFGRGCATRGYPGVYTRISHYNDWISNTAGRVCTQ